MTASHEQRIRFQGDIAEVLGRAAAEFQAGRFESFNLMPVGYEDYNSQVITRDAKIFVKIFNAERTPEEVERYLDIMGAVDASPVRHPSLLRTESGGLVYADAASGLSMVAMEFVEGMTFYDDGRRSPDDEELRQVLGQAVLIHNIPIKPSHLDDSWSIGNLGATLVEVGEFLHPEEASILRRIHQEFEVINIGDLPACFVHGDMTKSNCMKAADGNIFILDFSVANVYPRIQELAVITGNLLNSPTHNTTMLEELERVVNGYISAGGRLRTSEAEALPIFTRAAYAMEFLGAIREKHIKHDDSPETDYWMELGRAGLHKSFG